MKAIGFALVLALMSPAAFAEDPAASIAVGEPNPSAPTQAQGDNDLASAEKDSAEKTKKLHDRNCLRETGSRIKPKDKDACLPVAGRSYDKDDLDSTGASTVAEALQRLDPAISH